MKNNLGRRPGRHGQRGISLFVVLVMVLLTTLITVWAARTALFNELVTGNDSDYQRALEAAHAMVRDAELDIMGQRPDGQPCSTTAAFTNCRPAGLVANIDVVNKKIYFPPNTDTGGSESDFENLKTLLAAATPSCVAGICVGTNIDPEFWRTAGGPKGLTAMRNVGARYGEFTGATATAIGNPLLNPAAASAFYWVEPVQFQSNGSAASREFAPIGGEASATAAGLVYRITAVALGTKPGTQAVVQTIFVRKQSSGG